LVDRLCRRYNIAVTKYHDAEQRVTSVYDLFGQMSPPLVSLDSYLADGESLHDEDLVAWVSIGKEHLPRTEDVPLINNFGISFNLMPWNVFNVNGVSCF
jgi:primary-amine oxidase